MATSLRILQKVRGDRKGFGRPMHAIERAVIAHLHGPRRVSSSAVLRGWPSLLVLLLSTGRAAADDGASPQPDAAPDAPDAAPPAASTPDDEPDWRVDAAITAAGTVTYLLSEYAVKGAFAPSTCRWCAPPGFDDAVRDALVWDDRARADTLSDLLGFGATPVVTLGLLGLAASQDDARAQWPLDALLAVESLVVASNLNQAVKMAVGRERPFVHQLAPDDKAATDHPDDNNLSFYSGHTSYAFSIATAAGTIASRRGRRLAPVVWASGLAIATTTGWLRVAADKHWASDVVTGAVLGGAVGVVLPRLRLRRARVVPIAGGVALHGTF